MDESELDKILEECLEEVFSLFKFNIIVNNDQWSNIQLNYLKTTGKIGEFTVYNYPNLPSGIKDDQIEGFPTIHHPVSGKFSLGLKSYKSLMKFFNLE